MASLSFDHVAEARAALRTIVSIRAHGAAALSSVQIMSDLLPRLLPDAPRERSVLVVAAEVGLADIILRHVSEGTEASAAIKLSAESLAGLTPLPLGACYWVAAEIALALGLITADQADVIGSRCDAAAPSLPAGSSDPEPAGE